MGTHTISADKDFNKNIIFFIFAISGFTGLIYESLWSHYLKLFLGHSADAQTLVLIIFMGGMAIGAALSARYVRLTNKLFLYYALVELIIGCAALVFHPMFIVITNIAYTSIFPHLPNPLCVNIVKWVMSGLIILPQAILLGATFPLMSNAVIRRFKKTPGADISMLYFSNSLGAAIGVLICGFVLIYHFGYPGTMQLAGVLNILIAASCFYIGRKKSYHINTKPIPDVIKQANDSGFHFTLLVCAALTGTASFMYEIGWIRMLTLVLGSSTHAFELMLSAFIFGIALGGLWIKRRIQRIKNDLRYLAIVQIVMACLALTTLFFYNQMFHLLVFFMQAFTKNNIGYLFFNIACHSIAIIIMVPTTFCAGMTLPLITYTLLKKNYGEKSIGVVYAINTLGSIVGIILAVHFLMPYFTTKGVIIAGAGIDFFLGFYLLCKKECWLMLSALQTANRAKRLTLIGCVLLGIAGFGASFFLVKFNPFFMAGNVFNMGTMDNIMDQNFEMLYLKDGRTATISVMRQHSHYVIASNGKPDGSLNTGKNDYSLDEPTQYLLAIIPWSLNPNAKTVAVIGFGTGITSHTFLDIPSIKQVDTIEIEKAMVEGAKYFKPYNINAYDSPKSRIFYEDAKSFFASRKQKYDIIMSEPSNPWVSGVSGLFSQEFYARVKGKLSKNGLYAQWIHTYQMNMDLLASAFKAIGLEFNYYSVYATTDMDLLIVASNHVIAPLSDQVFSIPRVAENLARIQVGNVDDLQFRFLGNKKMISALFSTYKAPPNSDYFPYLDLHAVKSRYKEHQVKNLERLGSLVPLSMIAKMPPINYRTLTRSLYYTEVKSVSNAHHLYHAFLNDPTTLRQINQSKTLGRALAVLNPTSRLCINDYYAINWNQALYDVGPIMTLYLTPKELQRIWIIIKAKSCYPKIPRLSYNVLHLFMAVGDRNPSNMVKFSLPLFKSDNISSDEKEYYLDIAMLGNIARHRYQAALATLDDYMKDPSRKINTTTRLLMGYAKQMIRD